jgi:branched-chain amino acid transport system permease protein
MTDFHQLADDNGPSRAVWNAILDRGPALYAEYTRQPIGAHSPDLQFVLQHFRKVPCAGKYVLVALEPHKRWALGTLTGMRGDPVTVYDDIIFDDLAEAERYVFRQRWIEMTGIDPAKEA